MPQCSLFSWITGVSMWETFGGAKDQKVLLLFAYWRQEFAKLIISESFPLSHARRAFQRAAERGILKVLLNAG